MNLLLRAASAAALLFATPAFAGSHQELVTLPDGSKVALVTSRDGGIFRSQEAVQLQFHCTPTCAQIQGATSSNPGIIPSIVPSLITGASVVQAARSLRPDQTFVSASADGARAESNSDAYSRSESASDADSPVDVRITNPASTTSCCTPPSPPPPPPPPPPIVEF